MKTILLLTSVLFLFSDCRNKEKNLAQSAIQERNFIDTAIVVMTTILQTQELIQNTIATNDTIAYHKIANKYFLASKQEHFLLYALEMAYKNKCAEAYYNIYEL